MVSREIMRGRFILTLSRLGYKFVRFVCFISVTLTNEINEHVNSIVLKCYVLLLHFALG